MLGNPSCQHPSVYAARTSRTRGNGHCSIPHAGDYRIMPSFQCTHLEISACSRLESSVNHSVRIKAPLKMPVGPLLDMEAMLCVFSTCIPRGFAPHCFPIQVTHFGFHPFICFLKPKALHERLNLLNNAPLLFYKKKIC